MVIKFMKSACCIKKQASKGGAIPRVGEQVVLLGCFQPQANDGIWEVDNIRWTMPVETFKVGLTLDVYSEVYIYVTRVSDL